ncbi:WD40 repeat domain-containing protein [Vairimorpha necatrix]|uniref:U three protein 7 n=1 Tax=Vairimorpha necatrix TaxID=6039 RepID=A0AAX4JGP0_9MICR
MSKKLINEKIKNEKKLAKAAANEAILHEMLNAEENGFIDTQDKIKTTELNQQYIKNNVSQKVKEMCFSLDIKNGPIFCKYTRDGRFLNIRNKNGYFSSLDTHKMNLFFEADVEDTVFDSTYLHNEDFIALAQTNCVFIYNKQGVEVHAVRENSNVKNLEFLPYHFLLVSTSSDGFLRYQDTTNGRFVSSYFIKDKNIKSLKQNKATAVVYTGHKNGVVSLWTPNCKNPITKVLCHKIGISNIEIERSGTYMYTTSIDSSIKVWDIRKLYKPVNTVKSAGNFTTTSLSQRSILAAAYGDKIHIFNNLSTANKKDVSYLKHREVGKNISSLQFKNYEDILTIGHSKGVSNIIVPGSGDPTYDTFEDSPFITTRQKQDREVNMLLDKIPHTLIGKDIFSVKEKTIEKLRKPKIKYEEEDDKLKKVLSKYLNNPTN